MSFESIGPYRVTAADHIACTLILSFVLAARGLRIISATVTGFLLTVVGLGLASGNVPVAGVAALALFYLFIIKPVSRAIAGRGEAHLAWDAEGIVADTDYVRTLYKWATIDAFRKVGSRLFIMISGGRALIVPDRATNPDNMRLLTAHLADHQITV